MTALEVMIDEAAASLGLDPVAFRKANLLKTGGKTMVGNVVSGVICGAARCSTGWRRSRFGADARPRRPGATRPMRRTKPMASVSPASARYSAAAPIRPSRWSRSIRRAASRVASQAVEIGTGIATALAVRVADKLGVAADEVRLGVLDLLGACSALVAPDDPFTITREQQDEAAKNPRWVPDVAQDTTASISAHIHTAVAAEAANVILRFGLWPAALAIWSAGPFGGQAAGEFLRFEDVRFVDGAMTADGMQPLPLSAASPQRSHEMGFVTAAMVHGYNRWAWAHATLRASRRAL